MNDNTRKALIEFITTVEHLANAVSSVSGTGAMKDLIQTSEELKTALKTDETIL